MSVFKAIIKYKPLQELILISGKLYNILRVHSLIPTSLKLKNELISKKKSSKLIKIFL